MKKTLVIHPFDKSTEFLKICYENHLNDWDIINDNTTTKEEIINAIKSHERIIMMGHGTPAGLLAPTGDGCGRFRGYMVERGQPFVDLLKERETISIWCNSQYYFKYCNIPGFHTGMIISEVGEEHYVLGKEPLNEKDMLANMEMFARAVRDCIDKEDSPLEMKKYILEHYVGDDATTKFNRENIIVLNDKGKEID